MARFQHISARQAGDHGGVTRRLALALLATAAIARPARAQFPDRLISGIIPFDVGGSSDTMSRIVAAEMGKVLGTTIVMQNRPGAAGTLGAALVARSRPDGHTILFSSVATTQNPAVFRNYPFDPLRDLIPVAQFGETPVTLAINAQNMPVTTLAEFIALVRASPGRYNIAAGAGGQRITIERFLLTTSLQAELVAYRSGGHASLAVQSGEADFILADGSALNAAVQAGRVRMLAVAGERRSAAHPDVPTMIEAGLPGYTDNYHVGMYVAGGTPPALVARLHEAARKALEVPDVATRFANLGWAVSQRTQAEFAEYYREQIEISRDVVRRANIPTVD